jgi:Fe2+ transport system protein FeoA
MKCRLCGYEFEVDSLTCHTGCPFGDHCHLICCPNCGYQVVDDSRSTLVRFVDRVFRRSPRGEADRERARRVIEERLVPLSHVAAGHSALVRRLDLGAGSRANRLTVFGLAPGATVTVVQRRPAPVVRIGETELALGREILDLIWVEVGEGAVVSDAA